MARQVPVLSVGERARHWLRIPSLETFLGLNLLDVISVLTLAAIAVLALLAPLISPHDPTIPIGTPLLPPSAVAPFGTDEIGRDILSRVLFGARLSLASAVIVIGVGLVIGTSIGLVAGAAGGWVDAALMRFTDLFMALPAPLIAISIASALGPSFEHTLIAVIVVWWPLYARIVRGEVRSLASRPHFEAARLSGKGMVRLYLRHLLPGAIPTVIVAASLDVGALVLTLAGFSFLGLGAPQPAAELGSMAAQGVPYLLNSWWVPLAPAGAVFAVAFVANLAGDGVRNALFQ